MNNHASRWEGGLKTPNVGEENETGLDARWEEVITVLPEKHYWHSGHSNVTEEEGWVRWPVKEIVPQV